MSEPTSVTMTTVLADVGPVRLTMPPEASLLRVARLAASALASLVNCTIDEIEDVKIAVSETMIALIDQGAGHQLELEFHALADSFTVIGRTAVRQFDLNHPDLALCRMVLTEVCTELHIRFDSDSAEISATIGRSSSTPR
jgi:hypothetical protein